MTDANLADQIERWLADDPDHMGLHSLSEAQWRGIVVALRRQPSSDQALVLREPTHEQHSAVMLDEADFQGLTWERFCILYRAMLAAAEAELEKDAARYRWLRINPEDFKRCMIEANHGLRPHMELPWPEFTAKYAEGLDSAIDAAIKGRA